MTVDHIPGRVREFAGYLDGLMARIDRGEGWSRVFWQRDPEGMRACLEGREVPPWDVVEALLQDLGAAYGPAGAAAEGERARTLHTAALAAYDALPGARDALIDRLDVMLREQRYAAEREAGLGRRLSEPVAEAEAASLRLDLAWARDDHERATARCTELRTRLADLEHRSGSGDPAGEPPGARRGGAGGTPETVGEGPTGAAVPPDGSGRGPARRTHAPTSGQPSWSAAPGAPPAASQAPRPAGNGAGRSGRPGTPTGAEASPAGPVRPAARVHRGGGPFARTPQAADAPVDRAGPVPPALGASGLATAASDSASPVGAATPADRSPEPPHPTPPVSAPPAPGRARKRRRGSARFAGMVEDGAAPVVVPQALAPDAPDAPDTAGGRRTPRGARFAGAAEPAPAAPVVTGQVDDQAREAVAGAVERLAQLRAQGRSGEAHVLLAEAAQWPAARFPLLAGALHRVGLGADWATLLWEAASLPVERLVAVADELVATGREADGQQLLRHGVARPAERMGEALLWLDTEGRRREVQVLLDAYVRVRTPEEAARSVAVDPVRLVPLLLRAAHDVSEERHWDLVHALRVAGHAL
ncbi:hypothetical protein LK08_00955 [Streptomyces sp. MUSC 125]|uniref:hypothetical protein n=1 Tax=Streptomyces sp. MUSC 125 TaxID=1428624 RepID=UPI00057E47B5|nr:hypothetical protein [Streptomyces sp. MUSC 125]KIE28645.1 hypothetical protein LK08_00955 [Streptomyces sp. MUSC 125]